MEAELIEPKQTRATKQATVEAELIANPDRSDREIARVAGVDHKTVGAARGRISPQTGKNSPHNSPASPCVAATREMLFKDAAIAVGRINSAPDGGIAVDDPDIEEFWCIPRQAAIECRPLKDGGVEIWQEGSPGSKGEVKVYVAAANVVILARQLLWAAGFKSIGIYTYERGACVDVEDGHLASNFKD